MSTFICKDTVQVTQRSQEKSLTVLLAEEKQSAFYLTCWKAKSKDHQHITSNWFSGANKQSLNFEQKCSLFRNLNLKYQLYHTGSSDRILYVSCKTQHWECIYHAWALHTGCKILFLRVLLLKFCCSNIQKLYWVGREERIFTSHAAIPREIHLPVSSRILGEMDKRLF